MTLTLAVLLLLVSTLADLAQPDGPTSRVHDYNFLDVAYIYQGVDIDDVREDAHGFGVSGGAQVNDWISLWASSSAVVLESEYVNLTTAVIGIGVRTHAPVSDRVSTYATIGYLTAESETEWVTGQDVNVSVETDSNGYSLGAGLRASVLARLDLSVGVSLTSYEGENDTSLGEGSRVQPYRKGRPGRRRDTGG